MDELIREELRTGDRLCTLWRTREAGTLLVQPAGAHETASLEAEARAVLRDTGGSFALCAVPVEDWERELSPWPAPELYKGAPFPGKGARTLETISGQVLPALEARFGTGLKTVLGGYSLAGLFALWCAYETDLFRAVAAASPSVWFDGWQEYAAGREMHAEAVYLSLGDREEHARSPRLARVGDCIRAQRRLLEDRAVPNALVWEPGNHFQNAPERTARGFAWAMKQIK